MNVASQLHIKIKLPFCMFDKMTKKLRINDEEKYLVYCYCFRYC